MSDDLGQQLYALLVRRGYAQHEAYAIAHGARLAKVCTENCVANGEPSIECLEHGLPDTAHEWHPIEQECSICGTPRIPQAPPIDNAYVAPGCEQFASPQEGKHE